MINLHDLAMLILSVIVGIAFLYSVVMTFRTPEVPDSGLDSKGFTRYDGPDYFEGAIYNVTPSTVTEEENDD